MPARGPPRHDDPLGIATERGQLLAKKVDAGMDFSDDLIEARIRRERVADQRDIDAVSQWPFGK